ncbi:uncharacterized protein CC84DRAFT_1256839 [Paraphaeosphaeria sporulosa]|uniref:Uncharacterized protein n=1 Tax=Paraphaeosphaeria sporulosa TaxID=1460663 RepID=A0A177CK58_9PLEO|nr:uncharacterized protein CC84DRAFT_1256839 [Paraphaeosphaeria sporulosa]OAG07873.1 hypothetical protein CC84DRAFT_1256839 [Paraphaeosphaeria sporulosa]
MSSYSTNGTNGVNGTNGMNGTTANGVTTSGVTTNGTTKPLNPLDPCFHDGDGTSPVTAAWGPSFTAAFAANSTESGVIIDRRGVSPRFIRETLATARSYASMGYENFYDGATGEQLTQRPWRLGWPGWHQ